MIAAAKTAGAQLVLTEETLARIRPYADQEIRRAARILRRRREFRGVEVADLEGDLWVHLLEALPCHDPARGTVETYITVVIDRRRVSMIRNQNWAKRDPAREAFSLNDEVVDDGCLQTCEAAFLHKASEQRRYLQQRIHDALLDAPEHLREAANLFAHENITSIAKKLRITKEKARYYREALRIRLNGSTH